MLPGISNEEHKPHMFPRLSIEFYLVLSSMYNEGHLIILIFCKHVLRKLPAGTELSMCHYKVKTNKVKKKKGRKCFI